MTWERCKICWAPLELTELCVPVMPVQAPVLRCCTILLPRMNFHVRACAANMRKSQFCELICGHAVSLLRILRACFVFVTCHTHDSRHRHAALQHQARLFREHPDIASLSPGRIGTRFLELRGMGIETAAILNALPTAPVLFSWELKCAPLTCIVSRITHLLT